MPSQLVNDVRQLLRARAEEGRPVTDLERTFILSAVGGRAPSGSDVVDELEAAIAEARRAALTVDVPQDARRAVTRLLAAARAALDYTPAQPTPDVTHDRVAASPPLGGRPPRADIDG